MSQPLLLHDGPAASFEQPFELLDACHARMRRTLDLLDRLGEHLARAGCHAAARSAAADVLRYFDIAAPLHHQDEELHVLPRLLAQGHGALAARLGAEHQAMAHDWALLRPGLQAVADGSLDRIAEAKDTVTAEHERWQLFASLYRQHLAMEEALALPAARAGLASEDQQAMGREMARRRGVPPADAVDGRP